MTGSQSDDADGVEPVEGFESEPSDFELESDDFEADSDESPADVLVDPERPWSVL